MITPVFFRADRRVEEEVEPLREAEEADADEAWPVEGAGPRGWKDLVPTEDVLCLRRRAVGISERGDGDEGVRHCDGVVVEDGWACSGSSGGHCVDYEVVVRVQGE